MRKKDNKACYKPTLHLFLDTSDKETTKGKMGLQYIREIIRYINPGKNLFEFDEWAEKKQHPIQIFLMP